VLRNRDLEKSLEQTILSIQESQDIKSEIFKITEDKGVNAVIDCVGDSMSNKPPNHYSRLCSEKKPERSVLK
jgi:threonine dehydrogenase-like Zn-dependent dehydrogenase